MPSKAAAIELVQASDLGQLKDLVDDVLGKILPRSGSTSGRTEDESRLFKSGLELIGLKFKIGSQVELSIVFAGKDAPKLDSFALQASDTPPL